jgi:hypothetical protein
MKKIVLACLIATFVIALCPRSSEAKVDRQPGGIPAFLVGCCWGIREGSEWNEGADMHWREWLRIIPYAGVIFQIWDGVDCYGGITAHDWAAKNAANWY